MVAMKTKRRILTMEIRRLPDWNPDELYHHGIKGQRWGVRRYQNPDGSLTPEGVRRYGTVENFNKIQKQKSKGLIERTRDKRKMKKLRQAREQKKAWEAEKERIVNSGDKKAIASIQHELTDEQIARAVNRIAFNETVNGTNVSRLEKGAAFIDKYANTAYNIGTYAQTAQKIAQAIGAFQDIKKGQIPHNNGGNQQQQQPKNVTKEVFTRTDENGKKVKEVVRRKYD